MDAQSCRDDEQVARKTIREWSIARGSRDLSPRRQGLLDRTHCMQRSVRLGCLLDSCGSTMSGDVGAFGTSQAASTLCAGRPPIERELPDGVRWRAVACELVTATAHSG